MKKVICPVCGEDFIKPYSHFMAHVQRGEMEYSNEFVTIIKRSFRPTKSATYALPCGHSAAIVNQNDWVCGECGQSVRR